MPIPSLKIRIIINDEFLQHLSPDRQIKKNTCGCESACWHLTLLLRRCVGPRCRCRKNRVLHCWCTLFIFIHQPLWSLHLLISSTSPVCGIIILFPFFLGIASSFHLISLSHPMASLPLRHPGKSLFPCCPTAMKHLSPSDVCRPPERVLQYKNHKLCALLCVVPIWQHVTWEWRLI